MSARAALIAVPLAVALVLTLFAWPAARLEPRDLPVGVVGPAAVEDGSLDVHRYPDEASAREAIEEREVYGAFVATPGGTRTLTASAASPTVAQLLADAGEGPALDVVPVPDEDPRGAGLAAVTLPLVMAGMLVGAAATSLAPAGVRRAGWAAGAAGAAGLAATAIAQGWLGVVEGDWTANWAALSLTILAIALVAAGVTALVGRLGLALTAVLTVVVGNAFSGMSSAPELLPQPVGAIGQLLPPGAGGNLVRSTGLFDGAGAGEHLLVLAVWSVLGLAALLVGARQTGQGEGADQQPEVPQRDVGVAAR